MILFVDSSALAKRYVREEGSETMAAMLVEFPLATSRLTEVEIASALARRAREEVLTGAGLEGALAALRRDIASIYVVELSAAVSARAIDLLGRHALRAGDAIQLAAALHLRDLARVSVAFLAFDERLNAAATIEGLAMAGTRA